jgi:hypothetical protein
MLHQLNRGRDELGRVVADLEDYDVVREIVGAALGEGVQSVVPASIRETVAAVGELERPDGVPSRVVAERLKLDNSAAYRRLITAAHAGYVQNLEDRARRPGRWQLAEPLPDDVELLPTTACLQAIVTPDATLEALPAQQTPDTDGTDCTIARPSGDVDNDPSRCTDCGTPLDEWLVENGYTTHPACEGETP